MLKANKSLNEKWWIIDEVQPSLAALLDDRSVTKIVVKNYKNAFDLNKDASNCRLVSTNA